MTQVCPKCVLDDYVTRKALGPGVFEYVCINIKGHGDHVSYTWTATDKGVPTPGDDVTGPAGELGMLDDLAACVYAGEPWIEYGIIEARYAALNPDAFAWLRQKFGHRNLGPKVNPHFTASAYIAMVLSMLRTREVLVHSEGPATGEWSYNGTVSYWAKPPAPLEIDRTTCEQLARREGGKV